MTESKFYPYFVFTICFLSVALGAMNSVLAPAYLPDILKDLNHLSLSPATAGPWINFSFLAGGSIGGICLGFISDQIGRRKTLALSLFFCGAGSGLGALCSSWLMLALTRFIVGIGVGAALVVSVVILTEIWAKKTSANSLGIISIAYPAGIIASGLITSTIPQWRYAFFIGLSPIILIIPTLLFVHETLTEAKLDPEAKKISLSGYKAPLLSGILIYGTMLIGLWSAFAWLPTWVDTLFERPTMEVQMQRGMAVTLLGLGGLLGGLISGWLAERIGTRKVQAGCFILCSVLSFLLFKITTTFSIDVLIESGLLGFLFGISQGVLNILIPGLFPKKIRSSATGFVFTSEEHLLQLPYFSQVHGPSLLEDMEMRFLFFQVFISLDCSH